MLAERVDLEAQHLVADRPVDLLLLEVDGEGRVLGRRSPRVCSSVDLLLRKNNRQDAVLEAVVEEDVGEGGRDHAADAEIQQRPGRVLARGAAAEVLAGDQDLRVAVGLAVEHELRPLAAVVVEAQRLEQVDAEPGALDRLEVARRDDLVGVDVDQRQRRRDPGELGERLHDDLLLLPRPVMPAPAANFQAASLERWPPMPAGRLGPIGAVAGHRRGDLSQLRRLEPLRA